MPGTLLPVPHLQFLDSNGDPLASGTLESYEAGTSTPLATYSDVDLTVTNGTTITLNSSGRPSVSGSEVEVVLLPRAYKFILKNSAGATIWTADNVYALQAAAAVNLEIDGVAGEALDAGEACYLSDGSNSKTAGRWYLTDADFYYASVTPEIAFAKAAIALGATGTFIRGGAVTGLSGMTAGATQYLSATAGALTETAPANARSVGVASSATVLAVDVSPRWVDPSAMVCEGRLTLTTAVPVTTADVTAGTTLYWTPYVGNRVALYTGTRWNTYSFSELSITAVGLTASKPYDVFLYDNAGTLTLELLVWTNDTTRATALVRQQDGVLCKTGALTRRYLGTIYVDSGGGAVTDSFALRHVWNYYHRVVRPMRVLEATDSWTYTTATIRQANGSTANQLAFMVGVSEDPVLAEVSANVRNNDASGGVAVNIGVGLDSTTAFSALSLRGRINLPLPASSRVVQQATWCGYPGIGRHVLTWLERSQATGTTTWYGDDGGALDQSGISGWVRG